MQKTYRTIYEVCDFLGNRKIYHRLRRLFIRAYQSGRFRDDIINVSNGKTNRALLIEHEAMKLILRGELLL